MAFAAALTQAASAVAVVLIGWFVLGLAGFQLTQVASYTETLSFALVAGLGCGMAAVGAARLIEYCRVVPYLTPEHGNAHTLLHEHRGDCGRHHAPLPLSEGPNWGWRTAGVVVAVGLRPCRGR